MTFDESQVTEELRRAFNDTLDCGVSHEGILVFYRDGKSSRLVVGVPYSIESHSLVIGPYPKDLTSPPPEDYEDRKKRIPLLDIRGYKRVNLDSMTTDMFFFMDER